MLITGAAGMALLAYGLRRGCQEWSHMKRIAQLTKSSPFIYYHRGGFESSMSRQEAARILNIREYPTEEQVKAAHRKVMLANHPDRGGSPYLASKINEASTVLRSLK